jgi:hypothetical protein
MATGDKLPAVDGSNLTNLNLASSNGFIQNGNSFGALATLGTNDAYGLNLETANTPRIYIDNAGLVGIGAASSTYKLEVNSTGAGVQSNLGLVNTQAAAANVGSQIAMLGGSSTHLGVVRAAWEGAATTDSYMAFWTRGSNTAAERVRITSTGNVGIGTNNPARPLEINNATPVIRLDNASSANYSELNEASSTQFKIQRVTAAGVPMIDFNPIATDGTSQAQVRLFRETNTTGTKSFQIMKGDNSAVVDSAISVGANSYFNASGGNVGIGTAAPGSKLDVNGIIRATDICDETGANCKDLSTGWGATTVTAGAGTVGAPSISFSGDPNTGFYNASSNDTISVAANATKIFDFTTNGLVSPTTGGAMITTGNGTVGAPTFTFAGDTNMGWWRPAADTLAASTNGAERVRIDSSGNVGIGTTAPGATLDVNTSNGATSGNAIGTRNLFSFWPASASTAIIEGTFLNVAAGNNVNLSNVRAVTTQMYNNNTATTTDARAQYAYLQNGNTGTISDAFGVYSSVENISTGTITRGYGLRTGVVNSGGGSVGTGYGVYIDTIAATTKFGLYQADATAKNYFAGNVGIGTTNPGYKLQVDGQIRSAPSSGDASVSAKRPTASDEAFFAAVPSVAPSGTDPTWYFGLNNSSPDFQIETWDGSTESPRLVVKATGNVGIGTTNPASKLDVAGIIRATDICDETGANCKDISTGWGGSPGGANTQIQFNNSGAFGGSANFTWDNAATALNITKSTAASGNLLILQSTSTTGYSEMTMKNSGGTSTGWVGYGNASAAAHADAVYLEAAGNRAIDLSTNSNVRMKIDGSGNVGIGTTNPAFGVTYGSDVRVIGATGSGADSAANFNMLQFANTRATPSSSDALGGITFISSGDTGTYKQRAQIVSYNDGSGGANGFGGSLRFITKADNGNLPTEKMRIDNTGNVGIGTTNPASKLDVAGIIRATDICDETGANCKDISTGWGAASVSAGAGTVGAPSISFSADSDTGWWNPAANVLAASTAGSERMRIDGSGNVGIGTTSAWGPLDVVRSGGSSIAFARAFGGPAGVQAARANGTIAASSYVAADDKMGQFTAVDGKTPAGDAGLNIFASQLHTATNQGMYLTLNTVADGTTTSVERMRIDNQGRVGIGTTNLSATLEVNSTTGDGDLTVGTTAANAGAALNFHSRQGGVTKYSYINTDWPGNMQFSSSTGAYFFYNSGASANQFTILANGNVGVGTDNPNAKLQVEGAMTLDQLAADPAGTASYGSVYTKTDGKLYYRNGTGTITDLTAAGSSGGWTDGGTTVRLTTSSDNVGIGTGSAPAKLTVQTAPGGGALILGGADPAAAVAAAYISAPVASGYSASPVYSFWYQDTTGISNPANNTFGFVTNSTERMRITSAGNVGIGTTTAPLTLTVKPITSTNDGLVVQRFSSGTSNGSYWGTTIQNAAANDSIILGSASTAYTTGGVLGWVANSDSFLYFPGTGKFKIATGTGSAAAITVDTSNNVGIGTNTPAAKLDVVGDIQYTGTITDVSDRRLKENIKPLENGLETIRQIPTYEFTMKSDPNHKIEYGVMAQDVFNILPELTRIINPEKGYMGVNYVGLIPWSIRAIQDLDREVASVKSETADLRVENEEIKARLNKLEGENRLLMEQVQKLMKLQEKSHAKD